MATPPASVAVRVPLCDALALGSPAWDALLAPADAGSPFMTWGWHRAWANAVDLGEVDSCQAAALQSVRGLEALFPFRLRRTRFRGAPVTAMGWAIGDLGCPDHLDLLASPDADLDALVTALEDLPWEIIRLDNVATNAPNIERLCAACERRGWTVLRSPLWPCPYLELPESWEAYLSGLSATRRQTIRRKERTLCGAHDVALADYGPARLEEGWNHLRRLHARRWDGGGVFRDPAMGRLHRHFAARMADRDRLWLVTLDLDGVPAAAWYGFSTGDSVCYYQGGWDPAWERDSVGAVLMGMMIRRAIERGYRTFDFLRGEEPYKAGWTRTARLCHEVVVIRSGWRGAVLRGLDWIARRRPGK